MSDTTSPTTIHLVRHGRTRLNAEVRFRGRLEIPLDEVGRREAIATGRRLGAEPIETVYSSPLARALEVGTAIAVARGLDEVVEDQAFTNLDYGEWTERTKEEARLLDPGAWQLYLDAPELAACPDGERLADAADRVVDGLRSIGEAHPGGSVAVVSHGVMLRLAILRVAGRAEPSWDVPIATGSAITFTVRDGGIDLVTDVPGLPSNAGRAVAHS